jgi:3-oxoadipate enol-lactonase
MPVLALDDVEIHYEDTGGAGPPVLLVHAFPLSGAMWRPQIDAFGDRVRLVAPDLTGFGRSSAPGDSRAYSMDSYAGELEALLDHLGIARAVVVGLSMGGYIAFALLRRRRERVGALVLADTRAEADSPEGVRKRSDQQRRVRDGDVSGLADDLVRALLSERTLERSPAVVARARALMDGPAAGYVGALEALKRRPDSSAELAAIAVPTLVIVGEDDAVTPVDAARRLHEGIAGSRLAVLPGAGHLANLEAPEAFNHALEGFLEGL